MHRRHFLGVAAGTALTAGCLGSSEPSPVVLRAMPARGNETDVECPLSETFVADHPALQTAIRDARNRDLHEWAQVGISEDTAGTLVEDLHHHCESAGTQDGGLYHLRDEYYFVSISPREMSGGEG